MPAWRASGDAVRMNEKTRSMGTADIKDMVRARYGGIAAGTLSNCCAPSCCGSSAAPEADAKSLQMGYSTEELAAIPEGANLGLGLGNPQATAAIKPDETVVDLVAGSAGFDCRDLGAGALRRELPCLGHYRREEGCGVSLTARAARISDAAAIAAIYNEGIADRIATFETEPQTSEQIAGWFDGRRPIVVVENNGSVVAFASTSSYCSGIAMPVLRSSRSTSGERSAAPAPAAFQCSH